MEESGAGVSAAQHREAILAAHNRTSAGADAQLQTLLRRAHAESVHHTRRLDVIERSIDEAVARQSSLALDTPAGARQFQHFLLQKHREILAVVDDARSSDAQLQSQVQALSTGYTVATDYPADAADGGSQDVAGQGVSRGGVDGVHGTGDRSMPVILQPGELGPFGYEEAVPGTGIWLPQDEISGKMVIVAPGELAPSGYEQIGTAPDGSGVWWPEKPGPR